MCHAMDEGELMPPFTTILPAKETEKCYQCGEPAVVVLVNEAYNSDGAADELPLCEEHWKEILNTIPD